MQVRIVRIVNFAVNVSAVLVTYCFFQLTDVSPLVADCGLTVVATAASKYPECSVKAVNFQEAGVGLLLVVENMIVY